MVVRGITIELMRDRSPKAGHPTCICASPLDSPHPHEGHMSSHRRRSRWSFALSLLLLPTLAATAYGQAAVISGRLTGEQGNPLEVATVFITEMNIAQQTDAQGRYSITIPAERVRSQAVVLRARRIGHVATSRPITITPGPQTQDFQLKLDINRLSDVVVTGVSAGTEQKKMPFAVATVNAADMPVASSNALSQLQGKVTGAQIVMPSGRPGQAPAIVLRGPKSLNATGRQQGPLVIVDGIILNGGTQDINPLDIESIEVVKGAAGASLYGSRAGAGVIQITTKSSANGSPGVRFNIRNEVGFSDIQGRYPAATRHMLRMDESGRRFCVVVTGLPACSRTVDFNEEALRINENGGDFALPAATFDRDYGIGKVATIRELKGLFQVNEWPTRYDPVSQAVSDGLYNNINADMRGKFGNTGFFVSASHQIEEGAIAFLKGDRRSTARLNVDQRIGESWNVAINSSYARRAIYPNGEFFRLTRVPAGVNILQRDKFGRLLVRSNPMDGGIQNENPLYTNAAPYSLETTDRFLGSITTRYTPFQWLDFDANASMDRDRSSDFFQRDRGYRATSSSSTIARGNIDAGADAGLSYNMSVGGTARHDFTNDLLSRFNVRYTYEQQDNEGVSASGTTLAVPGLRDLDNATENAGVGSSENTVRAMGVSGSVNLEFKERYIFDALYRVDGSSLFGENHRWADYQRVSAAWNISDEPFWPMVDAVNYLKFRGSVGTAGGRPSFAAQYETFTIGAGGLVSANTLGNKELRPEVTTETEWGIDAELFNKYGVNITYARAITKDQIFPVPPSVSSGFASQWKNAGTLDSKTWEVGLNLPIVTTQNITWSSRLGYDRTRTFITELGVPEFNQSTESQTLKYRVGEQIGTIYGKKFVRKCSELPAGFDTQCGPGKEWQRNSEGYVVWVGQGNTAGDGITKNLWQAYRPGCVNAAGAKVSAQGAVNCVKAGGIVNSPWGLADTNWGMLTVMRDSTGAADLKNLGNTLPDYRITMSHNFQWKKVSIYGLIDRSVGNKLFNEELHWSLGDFNVREEDQDGKTVETAKPLGYYWRGVPPEGPATGVGGFYDVLGGNSHTVEDGSYTKLREMSLSYDLGKIPGVGIGDWSFTLTGKNLYTWTKFKGWDPEVGVSGGNLGSAALTAVAAFQYPPRRTFTFTLNSRF
jgi:TonB-linked SusC/RagA family outer membrane protein